MTPKLLKSGTGRPAGFCFILGISFWALFGEIPVHPLRHPVLVANGQCRAGLPASHTPFSPPF